MMYARARVTSGARNARDGRCNRTLQKVTATTSARDRASERAPPPPQCARVSGLCPSIVVPGDEELGDLEGIVGGASRVTWGGAAPKGTQDSVSRHTARAQSTGPPGVELELSRRRRLWEGGFGEERRQHPPYRPSIDSIDRTERSTILVTAHTRPNPSISQQQGVLDTAPCADISGELGSGGEFLTSKPRERVAAALPNVYLPETHFGVALGEARTLRTGTNEHTEHSPKRQNLAT